MFRKSLFLGLTLVLATVVVYLVVQSRRTEQTVAKARTGELVMQSPPSAIRSITPPDLKIDGCRLRLTPATDAPGKSNASVDVDIRNAGSTAYHDLMLRITLLDSSNVVIETQKRLLRESPAPGATLSAAMIPLDRVSSASAGCKADVLYAELAGAGGTAAK